MSEKEKPDFSAFFSDPTMLTALSQLIRGLTGSGSTQSQEKPRTISEREQRPEPIPEPQHKQERMHRQEPEPESEPAPMRETAGQQQEQEEEPAQATTAKTEENPDVHEPVIQILTNSEQEANPLAGLLQNPNLLVSLPRILSAAGPILSALAPGSPTAVQSGENTEKAIASGNFREKNAISPHAALLHALRPYLSPHRQQAVDNIVKMAGLMETFRQLQPPESR